MMGVVLVRLLGLEVARALRAIGCWPHYEDDLQGDVAPQVQDVVREM